MRWPELSGDDGGRRLGPEPRHSIALEDCLARLAGSLPPRRRPSTDPEQLLITTVALCFFPIEHNDTMLAAMGLDATSDHFAEIRRRHVVDVLLRLLTEPPLTRPPAPPQPRRRRSASARSGAVSLQLRPLYTVSSPPRRPIRRLPLSRTGRTLAGVAARAQQSWFASEAGVSTACAVTTGTSRDGGSVTARRRPRRGGAS